MTFNRLKFNAFFFNETINNIALSKFLLTCIHIVASLFFLQGCQEPLFLSLLRPPCPSFLKTPLRSACFAGSSLLEIDHQLKEETTTFLSRILTPVQWNYLGHCVAKASEFHWLIYIFFQSVGNCEESWPSWIHCTGETSKPGEVCEDLHTVMLKYPKWRFLNKWYNIRVSLFANAINSYETKGRNKDGRWHSQEYYCVCCMAP